MASLKKEAKNREKECCELKETLKRQEREARESVAEADSLRSELKKQLENQETERHRAEL